MIGWFVCPMLEQVRGGQRVRYCAMADFDSLILADSGAWAETEVLGNSAIVKVRAAAGTLATIAAGPGFARLPLAILDDPLSTLTPAQRTAIRDKALELGYTQAEIDAQLPGPLGNYTLRQVLRFIARRRLKPRLDVPTDTIVLDGPEQLPRTIESVDGAVT